MKTQFVKNLINLVQYLWATVLVVCKNCLLTDINMPPKSFFDRLTGACVYCVFVPEYKGDHIFLPVSEVINRYPVISFHGHFVPSHFVPQYSQFVPQNSQFVPRDS